MQPVDEGRHAPGPEHAASDSSYSESLYSESWYFDFCTPEGVGGYVHLALHAAQPRAWYWACLVQPHSGPVVVRDHDVAPPRGDLLEIRADGLWAECVCETPFDHWSLGLEAFGVRLDDPYDAFRGELGERLPMGHDLSWEATGAAHEPGSTPCGGRAYLQPGRVHGEVLLGRERIDIDGVGHRAHVWGAFDWRAGGWQWNGITTTDGGAVSVTALDGRPAYGARWPARGAPVDVRSAVAGVGGITIDGEELDVEEIGAAPLAFDVPRDDRPSSGRLWRALCRYEGVQASGVGWSARVIPTTEEQR